MNRRLRFKYQRQKCQRNNSSDYKMGALYVCLICEKQPCKIVFCGFSKRKQKKKNAKVFIGQCNKPLMEWLWLECHWSCVLLYKGKWGRRVLTEDDGQQRPQRVDTVNTSFPAWFSRAVKPIENIFDNSNSLWVSCSLTMKKKQNDESCSPYFVSPLPIWRVLSCKHLGSSLELGYVKKN